MTIEYKRTKKLITALVRNDFPQCEYCTKINRSDGQFGGGWCQCSDKDIPCAYGKDNHFTVCDTGLERLIGLINEAVAMDEAAGAEWRPFPINYKCDKQRRLKTDEELKKELGMEND